MARRNSRLMKSRLILEEFFSRGFREREGDATFSLGLQP